MNLWNPSAVASVLSSEFCLWLTHSLLHFLWQGLAIGLMVWILDRLLRRAPSQWRYAASVAAMLAMLACLPATFVALGYLNGDDQIASAGRDSASNVHVQSNVGTTAVVFDGTNDASASAMRPVGDQLPNTAASAENRTSTWDWRSLHSIPAWLAPYATLGYLLGVVIMLARLGLALRSGHHLRQSGTPLSDPAILAMAARQARRIGLKVVPAIAWCQRAAVPLVVGIIKPVILLPTAIASGLAPDQLEALLAHELAHLKRLDLLVNLVQRLAESLLFFHPAVWYVSRKISIERENCCDDRVLAAGWGRVEYADALVRMAEICAAVRGVVGLEGAALLAASGEGPSQFKRRVLRLLDAEEHLRIGISRRAIWSAIGLAILAALVLSSAHVWTSGDDQQDHRGVSSAKPDESDQRVKKLRLSDKGLVVTRADGSEQTHRADDKVAAAPPEDNNSERPKEKLYVRGQDALDRIDKVKPVWSEAQHGVEFGVALIGGKNKFRSGERVPLEMFVRNVGKKEVKVSLTADFLWNVPEVKNAAGEVIAVERILLFGLVPVYRETLKPGEAFGFGHVGLGLGPSPTKKFWYPFWAEPKPGKYTLRHTQDIEVAAVDDGKPAQRLLFTSGAVEFEVEDGAAGDRRPPADDAKGTLQAALLDRREYFEQTFPNEERLIKNEVFVADQKLAKAKESLAQVKRLAAKGLVTPIQVEAAELTLRQAQGEAEAAQTKLDVLRKFTKEKTIAELDRKVAEAIETLLDQRVALKVTGRPLIFVLDDLEKAH
ncbi:MAG TPA: M56 family metallopeptidase, partial [Pirellulaceae bacterium]|nr:M56 family metallopeptidase [Pirellulaceae bacterium]